MFKKTSVIFSAFLLFQVIRAFGWGVTGHRVVGEIAEKHLTKKAKKKIEAVLGDESLAVVSNWMDNIKSDYNYNYTTTWHWVTIPEGKTYEETKKDPKGDIIDTIDCLIVDLKNGGLSNKEEAENLKMLIHLIGDIHQPLHVGGGEDAGGNDILLKWFWEDSNLHKVWDTDMIDSEQYSYTELANVANHATKAQIKKWQSTGVREWAYESMALRDQIYALPDNKKLGYAYRFKNWETVQMRLLQAGVRLAGVLNDIYK